MCKRVVDCVAGWLAHVSGMEKLQCCMPIFAVCEVRCDKNYVATSALQLKRTMPQRDGLLSQPASTAITATGIRNWHRQALSATAHIAKTITKSTTTGGGCSWDWRRDYDMCRLAHKRLQSIIYIQAVCE
jgi:hypothetical protein